MNKTKIEELKAKIKSFNKKDKITLASAIIVPLIAGAGITSFVSGGTIRNLVGENVNSNIEQTIDDINNITGSGGTIDNITGSGGIINNIDNINVIGNEGSPDLSNEFIENNELFPKEIDGTFYTLVHGLTASPENKNGLITIVKTKDGKTSIINLDSRIEVDGQKLISLNGDELLSLLKQKLNSASMKRIQIDRKTVETLLEVKGGKIKIGKDTYNNALNLEKDLITYKGDNGKVQQIMQSQFVYFYLGAKENENEYRMKFLEGIKRNDLSPQQKMKILGEIGIVNGNKISIESIGKLNSMYIDKMGNSSNLNPNGFEFIKSI